MASQAELEEKQFQDDLAKATALSLEQKEFDDRQRERRYGRVYGSTTEAAHQRFSQHSNSGDVSAAVAATLAGPPSFKRTTRSNSVYSTTNNNNNVSPASREQSQTPPPSSASESQTESDLISFVNPDNASYERLVEDVRKLQPTGQNGPHTMLVPLGRTAAGLIIPPQPVVPQPHMMPYGMTNGGVNAAAAVAAGAVSGMQLVPYMAGGAQQGAGSAPKPLTKEELQKLYSMPPTPAHYSVAYMGAVPVQYVGGFVPPPHAVTQSAPATASVSAAFVPPQYPNAMRYGFSYGPASGAVMTPPPPPTLQQPQYYGGLPVAGSSVSTVDAAGAVATPPLGAASSNALVGSSLASGSIDVAEPVATSTPSSSSGNAMRRPTPPLAAARPRNKADLIDFHQEDDLRVSVLNAFDPLLNDDNNGDSEDNGSDCTSYYAEYDPFDYLYSGGGTQCSDPVYEAVHKLDKSAVSPNVSTIGWRQEYVFSDMIQQHDQQQPHHQHQQEQQQKYQQQQQNVEQHEWPHDNFGTSLSPPPPLPPRNSGPSAIYPRLSEFITNEDYEAAPSSSAGAAVAAAASVAKASGGFLDRRKTSQRLYETITDQRKVDPELLEFYAMVKDLRSRFPYDDEETNVGHIIASEFDYPYPLETSIKIVVHPALTALFPDAQAAAAAGGQLKGYGVPVVFTCDITTAVELVMTQAYCSLEGQIRGNVSDYAVKPIGVTEWLSPSSKLSQLECVNNCLKLERDVHLGLCPKTEENMKVIARTQRDDMRELRLEDIMPNETASTISYDNMMILIETFETEIDKLESAVSDCKAHNILSCSGVVQAVKAISALLGCIETIEISRCIAELRAVCEERQKVVSRYRHDHQTNPEIADDCGDYAEVYMRPRSLLEQVQLKCNQLRDAVQELVELYSNVFCVGFSVKTVDYTTTPIPISCVSKPIVVSINCLHRPPPIWKYDDYSLGVQISYGTRSFSDAVVTKCSNEMSGGLFPRLCFSSWITFEKNPICTLPRESRLIFVLYGTLTPENEPNSDAKGERRPLTELGWCSIQLFDYKREMICGPYLLSLWPPTTDKFLGPAPARGSHPNPDLCPVLSIEVPPYGGRIMFPEPLEDPPPAPRFDFNSLDPNLQQELLDTAEQGYPGATDKREVFWEKRFYLQNLTNALPKVLHAAHSWDYASLIDLQSLLYSWAPLSPLQALELLLPRYSDAIVRQKAVEWISYLPNDQLVDYLPQLLQALKHDTYEASAMARFLLCKCLESPRIAHHMYWLLVHSLPGDDPQNSIDDASALSSELDSAMITQARYYRRNKMMLRALLAICGEKLTARFLRQNNMCRHLAKAADSVKEAKESLRQKALYYGMDTVHQDLLGEPTALPLGPQLEVTGVNVRNCSYFNSKTLPLKISYFGSDNELLPAIFKSGDDLQQDMLTIQLIRVMNKMWLAERLDLKIVTFNCVPTGHKKGMIQLVSEAETLRKIQMEYGLTGSFKDRPIDEWLAKQNPSQLEYQRAVTNFTVSCAGYSVATYLLGVRDRHNDNIMLKTSGHLFHIDFGKFLGDDQKFGNIKRDRTPFVFTSDMAYVINRGDKPSTHFHYFVDLCCRAFNIIRKHGDLILHMLALMATAGIPGVTADAVSYVRAALLPSQSNPEAAASFAKMIQSSLNSVFTQWNFFFHNLAQIRTGNDDGGGELLSFVPRKYTMQQDGRLKSVRVVRCQKHYDMEKYYTYILEVTRHGQPMATHLFRMYKEFTEFHQKLCIHFPLAKLHSFPTGLSVGRSNVKSVAEKRFTEIHKFLESLFSSPDEIAHSDLVYTFFHPLLRDQQKPELDTSKVRERKQITHRENLYEVGQIKLSLQYRRGALTVMIHHAKGLPMLQGGQEPNTYVKCYLKPDGTKVTKRKTKVVRKTCVPSFMEALEYRMPIEYIQQRVLHVTVWSHDTLQENELLGGFQIDLSKYDLNKELIDWFQLGPMPRN